LIEFCAISQVSPKPSVSGAQFGGSAIALRKPCTPAIGSAGPSNPFSASSADHRPLRAALPTLMLLAGQPRHSHRPDDCVDALPSAQTMRPSSSPISLPAAVAAPNTPQLEVMCQPLA
jgi:hypothetical protein